MVEDVHVGGVEMLGVVADPQRKVELLVALQREDGAAPGHSAASQPFIPSMIFWPHGPNQDGRSW